MLYDQVAGDSEYGGGDETKRRFYDNSISVFVRVDASWKKQVIRRILQELSSLTHLRFDETNTIRECQIHIIEEDWVAFRSKNSLTSEMDEPWGFAIAGHEIDGTIRNSRVFISKHVPKKQFENVAREEITQCLGLLNDTSDDAYGFSIFSEHKSPGFKYEHAGGFHKQDAGVIMKHYS